MEAPFRFFSFFLPNTRTTLWDEPRFRISEDDEICFIVDVRVRESSFCRETLEPMACIKTLGVLMALWKSTGSWLGRPIRQWPSQSHNPG